MRFGSVSFAAALTLALNAGSALARCSDSTDAAEVAAARSQVATDCDCSGAPSHADYVRCAAAIAKTRAGDGRLARSCRADVVRCARRSSCGRPGRVACCRRATPAAPVVCRIEAGDVCAARGGCAGVFASCCDACDATGACVTTSSTPSTTIATTTTTTTLGGCGLGTDGTCGGDCPPGELCVGRHPYVQAEPDCLCLPATEACANATWPFCGEVGHCPRPDDYCLDVAVPPNGACTCITLP